MSFSSIFVILQANKKKQSYGLHNFAHRNTASGFLVPEDQTDFRGRMFRLSPALVNKFYELGLDWLLSGFEITPQVGDQALHRMRWYFRRHPNTVWVAYDWQQDRFPEERIPQQVYPEVVQGGSEWGDPMDSVVPYEDSRTKRRRTDDGWATALTVARSTPASPRNLSLIPVTGGHPAGLNTTAPPVQSRRAVPVGVRRASTGGTVPQPPLRLRHTPPRVTPSPSPVVAPSEQRAKSPEGLPRPDMANEDVIRPNVPTTPRVAPSSGREPSADDAVTPQLATPGVPDVVELPLKEFQAYQEACREQGVEIPGTVSEALTTASGLLRKAALYEWLTESVKAYRGSLETQIGLMCAQTSSALTKLVNTARRAERATDGTTPVVPSEVTEQQLNETAAVLRDRWRRHLVPAISYPAGDPIQEAIRARRTREGPSESPANRRVEIEVIDLEAEEDN